MGLFGNCHSCSKNLNFLSIGQECDFCRKSNCSACIEEFNFSDYYGNLKFFATKLEHLEIAIPMMEGRLVPRFAGDKSRLYCKMCQKCYKSLSMKNWLERYEEAAQNTGKITVIKGSSTKLNGLNPNVYHMTVVGSKLDLIEAFKIRAFMEGNSYIFELILEKDRGVWLGSCKAGKEQDTLAS